MSAVSPPPGFEWVRSGRATLLVRADVRSWLQPALAAATAARPLPASRELHGGRGGTRLVCLGERRVVLRAYRRGGLPARLLRDVYFGWRPRPFRELTAAETLRRRGAPVVETYGAAVRWLLPGCYRGWLATPYLAGAQSLWRWACSAQPAAARGATFAAVGRAVRRLHDCGGHHPDLNLNNILVAPPLDAAATPAVWFIDFDKATPSAAARPAADDLARLRRSARKLDPRATQVTAQDLAQFDAGYRDGGS